MSGPPAVLPAVAPGSRVALVAPAGPPPADLVERAVALLAEWGLAPVVLPSVTAAHGRASYLAGNGISYYGDHGDAVLTEASDSRARRC